MLKPVQFYQSRSLYSKVAERFRDFIGFEPSSCKLGSSPKPIYSNGKYLSLDNSGQLTDLTLLEPIKNSIRQKALQLKFQALKSLPESIADLLCLRRESYDLCLREESYFPLPYVAFSDLEPLYTYDYFSPVKVGESNHTWFVNIKPNLISNVPNLKEEFSEIHTASGVCLFGSNGVMVENTSGVLKSLTNPGSLIEGKVVDLHIEEALSLGEVESIARLSSFVRALSVSSSLFEKANLLVPREQYYAYAFPVNNNFKISVELLSKWVSEVDKRADRLSELFVRALGKEVRSEFNRPLAPINDYIKESIAEGKIPILDDAVAKLIDTKDPIWGFLLKQKKIDSWTALSHLSYVHYMINASKCNEESSKLTFQIDNHYEKTILDKVGEVSSLLPEEIRIRIGGIYPLEEILPISNTSFSLGSLFHAPFVTNAGSQKVVFKHYGLNV